MSSTTKTLMIVAIAYLVGAKFPFIARKIGL